MPVAARRVLGAVMAVLGIALAALGAWSAIKLGPSGELHLSATVKATGAIVVEPRVLNSLDIPVLVTATRGDGGSVWLAAAPSADAGAVLAKSAVSTVSDVGYPAGALDVRASPGRDLPDIRNADVWRLTAAGSGSTDLVIDQGFGPETVVVTSGDGTALTNVSVSVSWAERSWFFEALAAAVFGAIIAAFALIDLSRGRHATRRTDAVRATRSGVRT